MTLIGNIDLSLGRYKSIIWFIGKLSFIKISLSTLTLCIMGFLLLGISSLMTCALVLFYCMHIAVGDEGACLAHALTKLPLRLVSFSPQSFSGIYTKAWWINEGSGERKPHLASALDARSDGRSQTYIILVTWTFIDNELFVDSKEGKVL